MLISLFFYNSKFDVITKQRLIYINQKLQIYKKRKRKSIDFKLIKTKNALTKAKKNKNNKTIKYFAILNMRLYPW